MFAGKPITCAVNPCVGRETEIIPAQTPKNVVVVGGGAPSTLRVFAVAGRRDIWEIYEIDIILSIYIDLLRTVCYYPYIENVMCYIRKSIILFQKPEGVRKP